MESVLALRPALGRPIPLRHGLQQSSLRSRTCRPCRPVTTCCREEPSASPARSPAGVTQKLAQSAPEAEEDGDPWAWGSVNKNSKLIAAQQLAALQQRAEQPRALCRSCSQRLLLTEFDTSSDGSRKLRCRTCRKAFLDTIKEKVKEKPLAIAKALSTAVRVPGTKKVKPGLDSPDMLLQVMADMKLCRSCGSIKTTDSFYRSRKTSRLRWECKECTAAIAKRHRLAKKPVAEPLPVKKCTVCGLKKPAADYHSSRWVHSGLRPACKQCTQAKALLRLQNTSQMLPAPVPPIELLAAIDAMNCSTRRKHKLQPGDFISKTKVRMLEGDALEAAKQYADKMKRYKRHLADHEKLLAARAYLKETTAKVQGSETSDPVVEWRGAARPMQSTLLRIPR